MSTLDEVIDTVRAAREDGPEALAAMALSYGATMALGAIGNRALRGQIAELRAAQTAADEMRDALRHERDAACAELKHALESTAETRAEVWRLRESVAALRAERDESQAAHEHTRAQWAAVCRERDEAGAALVTAGKIAAEAVREREAFGLRLSAAERERDEARAERDALRARHTYEARTTPPTLAQREAHQAAGGAWLVVRIDSNGKIHSDVLSGWSGWQWERVIFVALGADRLPCAWPVVATEVTP